MKTQLDDALKQVKLNEKQKNVLTLENEELKKQITSHTSDFNSLRSQIQIVNDDREKLHEKINLLKQNQQEISKNSDTQISELQQQLLSLEEENSKLKIQLTNSSSKINQLSSEISSQNQEKDQIKNEVNELTTLIENIQNEFQNDPNYHGKIDLSQFSLQVNKSGKSSLNSQLFEALTTLRLFLLQAQKDIELLLLEKSNLSKEVFDKQSSLNEYEQQNKKLNGEIHIIENSNKSMKQLIETQKIQYQQLLDEKSHLDSGITLLQNALDKTKSSLKNSENEKENLKSTITQLQILLFKNNISY